MTTNGHSGQAIAATMPDEEELQRLQAEEEPEEEQEPGAPWDDLTEEQQDAYLTQRAWGRGW